MAGNRKENTLDYTNSLTKGFNEQNKAFDTVNVNSLVPVRYGKVDLTYITTAGCSKGKIATAKYYSDGVYQETRVVTRGNSLGSAHKTTINFVNKTPASLAGKAFVIYDDTGAVLIWFNVDGANTAPVVPATYRSIEVALLSTDNHEAIAEKTAARISLDASFISLYTSYFIITSSITTGVKPNSYDHNTCLYLKNTAGSNSRTLNNTYWFINSALNANQYYVWYNVSGGGTDPLIAGKTGIMVAISSTSTSAQVAVATKSALDATGKFLTNIDEGICKDTLLISNALIGASTSITENTSEFLVLLVREGEGRELLVTLELIYSLDGSLTSVERV